MSWPFLSFGSEPDPYIPPFVQTEGKSDILEKPALLKKVVFEDGIEIIGIDCFKGCVNLRDVVLPKSLVYISSGAFFDSGKISELSFPKGVMAGKFVFSHELLLDKVTFYSDGSLDCQFCKNPLAGNTTEAYVYYNEKNPEYFLTGYLKKLYVDPQISTLNIKLQWESEVPYNGSIKELVMNGKNTKLSMDKDIPYFIKKTGKAQTVKAKKKNGHYRANWKKVKTKIERHMDYNNWKGKLLKKAVQTKWVVQIYQSRSC